jgi:hypothetical protein
MATRDTTREPSGWVIFAGVMMLIIGFLNFFYGLAAIVNDEVVVVGGHGAIIADITTWGVITLILAVILVLTGGGLLTGAEWARWVGVFLVALNANRPGVDLPGGAAVGVHRDPARRGRPLQPDRALDWNDRAIAVTGCIGDRRQPATSRSEALTERGIS